MPTLRDIYEKTEEIKSKFSITLYRSIVYDYMRLIFESTLQGHKINLYNNLGHFYITVSRRNNSKPKKVNWAKSDYKLINGKRKYTKIRFHHEDYPLFCWSKGIFKNKKKFKFVLTKGKNESPLNNAKRLINKFKEDSSIFYSNMLDNKRIDHVRVYDSNKVFLGKKKRSELGYEWNTIRKKIDKTTNEIKHKGFIYKIIYLD